MNEKQSSENVSPVFQFLMERWQARGMGQRFPSCFIVEEFTRFANERNDARQIPQFENWLLIFDEVVNWFSSLALALKRAFLTGDEPKSIHLSVMTVLATKFAADLCSIRRLMIDGFEVQSRILTRSAVETVELMFVVPYHNEIERAFYEANDFEKTNMFWYEHIRKGKLRTKANQLTENILRLPPDTWKKFREEHEEAQPALAHPSTIMGVLAMFPDEEADGRPGHWGVRTYASVMTMRYLCMLCANVITLNHFIPFGATDDYPALLEPKPDDVNHQAIGIGREVIQDVMTFVGPNFRGELFDPKYFEDEKPPPDGEGLKFPTGSDC